jgi:predicted  nucleic acid-binding Zn-ribbon protein
VNNDSNQTGTARDARVERELNDLRRQYEQLRDRKVRTEEAVAQLTHQLETLKKQAEAEYGTSDLKELQQLLEKKRTQNEEVVAAYRKHVQQIQADLAQVENAVEGD